MVEMNVIQLLAQKPRREDVTRIIATLPDLVFLSWKIDGCLNHDLKNCLVILNLILADDLSGSMLLEFTHDVAERMVFVKTRDEVHMVGHDHVCVQLYPAPVAHIAQALNDDALDDVALEEAGVIHSGYGDEV